MLCAVYVESYLFAAATTMNAAARAAVRFYGLQARFGKRCAALAEDATQMPLEMKNFRAENLR